MNNDSNKRGKKQESAKKNEAPIPVQEGLSIDYMAKDYQSFRQLILDRLSQTYPVWKEVNVADMGMALVELLAYVGDHLSYYQDAVATEAYLGTARKRVSVKRHARLLDYNMLEGHNARAWVCFEVKTPTTVPKGTKLLTYNARVGKSEPVIALKEYEELSKTEFVFETQSIKRMYPDLHKINFHVCKKTVTYLPEGSTSAVLQNENNILFETLCSEVDLESQQDRIREVFREDFDQKWVDDNSIIEFRKNRVTIKNQEETHQAEFELASDSTTPLKINDKIIRTLYIQKDCNGKKRVCFLTINPGDVVIFEEIAESEIVNADVSKRWAVRLTDVKPSICEQTQKPIVEIQWMIEDATPFSFRLNKPTSNKVIINTIARGNVVLTDHGDTRTKTVTLQEDQTQIEFCGKKITHSAKYNFLEAASKIGQTSPSDSLPNIYLVELNGGEHEKKEQWLPKKDLLCYDRSQKRFKLEIDDDGASTLLFNKFSRINRSRSFRAIYRIGNGSAGNIGANSINRIVDTHPALFSQVIRVFNPLPAIGGVDPDDVEMVRHIAPEIFARAQADSKYNQKTRSNGVNGKNIRKSKCLKRIGRGKNHRTKMNVYNPPGQKTLDYRVGTYNSFKQSMFDDLRECNNLRGINFSKRDDFVFGLIDAWACICDILTFYQERIANEGYLRTATERKSVIELSRFVGRELSTGVAADAFLAFEVEENLDSNDEIVVPVGTRVQSIAVRDETPKIFETIEQIKASSDWNQIKTFQIIRYPRDLKKEDIVEIDPEVEGLQIGQYVALSGKIHCQSNKEKSEVVKIKKMIRNKKLVLFLDSKIASDFKVETVKINANVTKATHGESKSEILGSGDPTLFRQEFMLKYKPLTYINSSGNGDRSPTLQLFVNGIEWKSVPSFYCRGPNERCYIIRHDEYGNTLVIFGDGKRGARPPRGKDNIRANYRVGMGTEGMLKAGQLKTLLDRPFGIRSVTNPLATINARNPESVSEAKEKTSPHLTSLGRGFSSKELENFTTNYDNQQVERKKSKPAGKLYQLLPSIYRQRDAEENYPLKELLGVIEKQLDIIEEDIAQLYDNWFIETCEPWVIPYIADLLGVKLPYCNKENSEGNRAFVANSIKYLSCAKDNAKKPCETNKDLDWEGLCNV
jgi:hypothetical protein